MQTLRGELEKPIHSWLPLDMPLTLITNQLSEIYRWEYRAFSSA